MPENMNDRTGLRDSYRYPLSEEEGILFSVNDHIYELADIGSNGVGVFVSKRDEFGNVGDMITVMLLCRDIKITIDCRLAHITVDKDDVIRCGFEFADLDEDVETKLFECLCSRRDSYFSGF